MRESASRNPVEEERLPGVSPTTLCLHNPQSQRLDANRVAALFGISRREMSKWLKISSQTLSNNPDSKRLQIRLRVYERIGRALALVDNEEQFRLWLNTPNADLGQKTPLSLLKNNRADVIVGLVEDALLGQPS